MTVVHIVHTINAATGCIEQHEADLEAHKTSEAKELQPVETAIQKTKLVRSENISCHNLWYERTFTCVVHARILLIIKEQSIQFRGSKICLFFISQYKLLLIL